MDKIKYVEYLLRNAFRLQEELFKEEKDRELSFINILSGREKQDLVRDISTTINFYGQQNIMKKEVLTLRFLDGKLIKEVASLTNYSESNVKLILKESKQKLLNLIN